MPLASELPKSLLTLVYRQDNQAEFRESDIRSLVLFLERQHQGLPDISRHRAGHALADNE